MSFSVEKVAVDPIIVTTLCEDYRVMDELPACDQAVLDIIETTDEPQFLVVEVCTYFSMDEMIYALNRQTHPETGLWRHPGLRGVAFATSDEAMKMAAKGLNTEAFHYMEIEVFDTVDEAVDYFVA